MVFLKNLFDLIAFQMTFLMKLIQIIALFFQNNMFMIICSIICNSTLEAQINHLSLLSLLIFNCYDLNFCKVFNFFNVKITLNYLFMKIFSFS